MRRRKSGRPRGAARAGGGRYHRPGADRVRLLDHGAHAVHAYADYGCDVVEDNDANNKLDTTVDVKQADLIVDSIVASPDPIFAGEPVTFTVTLHNSATVTGAIAGHATRHLQGSCDDPGVSQPRHGVGHGGRPGVGHRREHTAEVMISGGIPNVTGDPDAHTIVALADSGCGVNESDEGNNNKSLPISVLDRAPDLVIDNIEVSPAMVPMDGKLTITVSESRTRAGPRVTGNYFAAVYAYGDRSLPRGATPPSRLGRPAGTAAGWLSANDDPDLHISSQNLAGSHTVYAVVDDRCGRELHDDNNKTGPVAFQVGYPDLEITSLSVEPPAAVNQPFTMTAVVANTDIAAAGAFKVQFSVDSIAYPPADVASLPAGVTRIVTKTLTVTDWADHAVTAVADYLNVVTESDEANNTAGSVSFHVPRPDLVIDSITPNPLNPQPGQPITYTVHLRNAARAPARPPACSACSSTRARPVRGPGLG